MKTYIAMLRFTPQGAKNIKESPARGTAFRQEVEAAGVHVVAQYWTVGDYDGVLILSGVDENKVLHWLADLASRGNMQTSTLRALDAAEFSTVVAG